MYWLPKLHKTPIGDRYIIASKNCSTKPLSSVISKIFKMLFRHVENVHKKSRFYFIFLKFFLKWGNITTSKTIPLIQNQTFLKMTLLKTMKTIVKNLILN